MKKTWNEGQSNEFQATNIKGRFPDAIQTANTESTVVAYAVSIN